MQWLGLILVLAYILTQVAEYRLRSLNVRHMKVHAAEIPAGFEGSIDAAILEKTVAYTTERAALASVESVVTAAVLVAALFSGVFDACNSWAHSLRLPFVLKGMIFFLLIDYANTLISAPFSIYSTFRIEQKYGFNTMTPGLWIADLFKGLALSTVLMGAVLAGAFFIVQRFPEYWWLFAWGFFLVFSVFMMYIAPYVIEPLFNKYSPVDAGLQERIREMMRRAGIEVKRVFTMDASRRSRHANAYFTGIGRVKRIVLFDTISSTLDENEILAVLAHEAGHWKKRHILKRMIAFEAASLAGLFLASLMLRSDFLAAAFGLHEATFFAQAALLAFIAGIVSFPATPLLSALSRRHEYEADSFATGLAPMSEALASALIKLSRDNLANLHPHPLYAAFYYSHPPVVERVGKIMRNGKIRA
ncbi:MAG: M48 family metallopeptidase [Nitrospiraceae bacterium]|nr:M48 family metallopeptidase [Nitrospiraceae bacterium]